MSTSPHKTKIVILSGAGISAESGINTFRDAGGLWEGHDVMDVASVEGWERNRQIVLSFYNERRQQLKSVHPNDGHKALVELEKYFDCHVITQNVDDLHERAGSSQVVHLHGQLLEAKCSVKGDDIQPWHSDILFGDLSNNGYQLRPNIVWFGEQVPLLEVAIDVVSEADICIIVGTSLSVYPAANLYLYAPEHCSLFYVDPKAHDLDRNIQRDITRIVDRATTGLPLLVKRLIAEYS